VVVVGPDAGAVVGGPWPGWVVGVAREVGTPATVVSGLLGAVGGTATDAWGALARARPPAVGAGEDAVPGDAARTVGVGKGVESAPGGSVGTWTGWACGRTGPTAGSDRRGTHVAPRTLNVVATR